MTRTTADTGFCTAWHAERHAVPAPASPGAFGALVIARRALEGDGAMPPDAALRILAGPAGPRIARAALAAIRTGTEAERAIATAAYTETLTAQAAARAAARQQERPA